MTLMFLLCSPLMSALPQSFTVTVDKGDGEMVELNLTKHSIRYPGFRVRSWDATNGYVDEHTAANPLMPVRTYRGYVSENTNHLVLAVVHVDDTLQAEVHDGSGRLWQLDNLNVAAELGDGTSTVPAPAPLAIGGGAPAAPNTAGAYVPPVGLYTAHGVEDVTSRSYKGSVDATLAWLEYQWNVFDYFNARDAKLNMQLSEVIVRKEQFYFPDTGSAGQFNSALRGEWLAQGQNPRAFIHSWFPNNYSYAGGYNTGKNMYAAGGEAIAVNALYHEVAHAWRAEHYLYGRETMTGSKPAHSEMNTQRVLWTRQIEIDEDDGIQVTTSYPTNLHPRAFTDLASTWVDTAVNISPLSNDYDANGDVISIKSYLSTTATGGTVSESSGVLTYTPANGYVGKDIIVYEVQDAAGLYTKGLIHIEVINGGLAAHWTMEDASGSNATDQSGHGHTGKLQGVDFSTASITGPMGKALVLGASDYVIGDDKDLVTNPDETYPLDERISSFFDPMDEDFTVSTWIKLADGETSAVLFSKDNKSSLGYRLTADTSSGLTASVKTWDGIKRTSTATGGTISPGTWYHVSMVINRSDNTVRLFLNGAEVASNVVVALQSGQTLSDAAEFFVFNGRDHFKMGGEGALAIDDTRIYTKALSLGEIQTLYTSATIPAGNPAPIDGALAQSSTPELSWLEGQPTYQHDVYFGTDAAAVAAATVASPEYMGRQSAATYSPATLNYSANYFWRIDEVDGSTVIPGAVWTFSTAATALSEQLVLHLTMDDEDVQVAEGVAHTYDDIAFPAHDFDTLDTVTSGSSGVIGEAVDLTGLADTLRSYEVTPISQPRSGGVTFSFWIKTSSTNSNNEMVYSVGGAYFMIYNNGDLTPVFDGGSGGAQSFNTNINDDQWHHVVAQNDGVGTTTVYVDGVSVGSQSESLYAISSLNRGMAIGSEYDGIGKNIQAAYDDFAVWQRTLTFTEIASIYTSGLAGESFNDVPFLVNSSLEVDQGFSGFASDRVTQLGTVTDSNGVIWQEQTDANIWNRANIPPDGVQVITLGNGGGDEDGVSRVDVLFPGSDHGMGTVSFDYASYSSATDATFRLLYSTNDGDDWTEAWSTQIIGDSPKYGQKPWPSAEVGINIPGNVDLRFESSGIKGAKFDNVKITGMAILDGAPAIADASVSVGDNKAVGAEVLTVSASDPDLEDTLSFSITSGNTGGAFSIDSNGVITTAAALDHSSVPSYVLTVTATDNGGLSSSAIISIVVSPTSGLVFGDDFERTDGTNLDNGWIEQSNDSRIYSSSGTIGKHVISVNQGESFVIIKQMVSAYTEGSDYRLNWNATRGTTSTGTLEYDVALGVWDGFNFTPFQSVTGTISGLHKNLKVEGPEVAFTASSVQEGQKIAIRLSTLAGSDSWVGFDDIDLNIVANHSKPYTSNIYAWYQGDDGIAVSGSSVTSWANKASSGSDRDLNRVIGNPTLISQALSDGIYSSAVRFDGTSGLWAAAGDFGSVDSDRTIFVYARLTDGSDGFLFDGTTNSGISRARVKTNQWQVGSRSSNNGGDDPVTGAATSGVWQLHAFEFDYDGAGADTTISHWVDGVLLGSHMQSGQRDLAGLMLGADVSGSNYLQVDVAEMLVYDAVLAVEERDHTRAYFEAKWDGVSDVYMSYVADDFSQETKTIPAFGVHAAGSLKIETFGESNPFDLTGVTFNFNGTTSISDIQEVRIYSTAGRDTFDESNLIASQIVSGSSGDITFSLSSALTGGDNYFWLAVVPKGSAAQGNVIDTEIVSFSLNGAATGTYSPINTAPTGSLTVGAGIYSQVLRKLGDDGVVKYRIPGLATTNAGSLIAVFDIRNTSGADLPGNIDVGMMRSVDNGITWSPMQAIMDHDSSVAGSSGNGVGDPAVLVDSNTGRIWVMATHSVGNNSWNGSGPGLDPADTGQLEVVYSDDDGLTWTDPINITAQVKTDPNWHFVLQGPGNGITLRNGMIAFPLTVREIDGLRRSTFVVSDDNGASWHTGPFSVQAETEAPATTESQIVELDDGRIMISMRNHDGRKRRAWSTYSWDQQSDQPLQALLNGTWTPSIPGGDNNDDVSYSLLDPKCQASFIRYSSIVDGDQASILLFSNPASSSGRVKMTIRASIDQGQTWAYSRQIDSRPAAYSSMTRLADGSVGIFYETGDTGSTDTLTFARFPLSYVIGESNAPIAADSAATVAENVAIGTAVGTASFIEIDQGETLNYVITAGNTGGAFAIHGDGNITTATVLDYDLTPLYSLTVTATDSQGVSSTATVTVTVSEQDSAPVFTHNPIVAADGLIHMPYSATLDGQATDDNVGDLLTFQKISGPAWLSVATDGSLSGTPVATDSGLNIFEVEVADGHGGTDQASLQVNVQTSGLVFSEDFESYDVENPSDFSVSGAATVNWGVSDTAADATRIYNTSNFGGSRLWITNVDGVSLTSSGIPVAPNESYSMSSVLVTETSFGNRTLNARYNVLVGQTAATAVSVIGGPQSVVVAGDGLLTDDSKEDHLFSRNFQTGTVNPGDRLFIRFERVDVLQTGGWFGVDDVELRLQASNQAPRITGATASVAENLAANEAVVSLVSDDPDAGDQLSFAITAGNSPGLFAIDSNGNITTTGPLNYEALSQYVLTVAVTDDGDPQLSASATVTINVTDVIIGDDSDANGLNDNWEMFRFAALGTVGQAADADGDGLTTYEEMVFGFDPKVSDAGSGPLRCVLIDDGGTETLEVKLRRPLNHADLNVSYKLQTNTTLEEVQWVDSGLAPTGTTVEGDHEWVRYLLPVPSAEQGKIFVRCEVQSR